MVRSSDAFAPVLARAVGWSPAAAEPVVALAVAEIDCPDRAGVTEVFDTIVLTGVT